MPLSTSPTKQKQRSCPLRNSAKILQIIRLFIVVVLLLSSASYINRNAEYPNEQLLSSVVERNENVNSIDSNSIDSNSIDSNSIDSNSIDSNSIDNSDSNVQESIVNILNQNIGTKTCQQQMYHKSYRKGKVPSMVASVTCPCGRNTTSTYRHNMAKMYGTGSYDTQTLERCLNLPLPLKHDDPIECWPKMIVMPSFPTNGSGLARLLLQRTLGLLVRMDQYLEGDRPMLMYDMSVPDQKSYHVSSPCDNEMNVENLSVSFDDTSLPIPLMGKPAIYKTHHGKEHLPALKRSKDSSSHIAGVIRLARNPGDQILRNYHRWGRHSCYGSDLDKKEECFRKGAHLMCGQVSRHAKSDWLQFHRFWNSLDEQNITQVIYHYENFSNVTKVEKETQNVLDYLKYKADDGIHERIEGVANEALYKHGTMMAEICGKNAARKLHEITKDVTKRLGYTFDKESATWSLPDDP